MPRLIGCLVLGLFLSSSTLFGQGKGLKKTQQTVPKSATATYTPDVDLKSAPAYYRERVIRFRNMMRAEPTREAKIAKARALATNAKSEFRRDAIDFLGEVRASEAVPDLFRMAKVPDIREFCIHALGEIGDGRAVPLMIHYLNDPNEDVRGNAERAFQRITRVTFEYHYADPPAKRKQGIREIQLWWERNKATFKARDETPDEKKAAEESWEKYGRQYLYDLNR